MLNYVPPAQNRAAGSMRMRLQNHGGIRWVRKKNESGWKNGDYSVKDTAHLAGKIPTRLFKYVSQERIDVLENLCIRFTPPSCFNDPFEARFCIDGLDDPAMLNRFIEVADRRHYRSYVLRAHSTGERPIRFDEFQLRADNYCRPSMRQLQENPVTVKRRVAAKAQRSWDDLGILSLTATENNLLMWAHYSRSHEGILIEFDPGHRFFRSAGANIELGTLVRVTYCTSRPRHKLGDTLQPYAFTVKSSEWEYEQEWRIFQLLERSDSAPVVNGKPIHLFKIPPKAIKRVICGCRISDSDRLRVLAAVAKPQLHHVAVRHAVPSVEMFAVDYSKTPPPGPVTIKAPWSLKS